MKDIKVFKVCLAHKMRVCKMKKPFTVPGSLSHLPALPKPHGFIYPPAPVLHRSQHALGQACSQLAHRAPTPTIHTRSRAHLAHRRHTHISPLAHAAAALHRRSCPRPQTHAPACADLCSAYCASRVGSSDADLRNLLRISAIGATAAGHRCVAAQDCGQPFVRLTRRRLRVGYE